LGLGGHAERDCGIGGLVLSRGTRNKAYGNLIINNGTGVHISGNGNSLMNNTIYKNRSVGINIKLGVFGTVVSNNILYFNGSDFHDSGVTTLKSHNFIGDPQFVDANALNFRLRSTSPVINKGDNVSDVKTDIDGNSRPQGGIYDIGAYEFVESSSTPSTMSSDLQPKRSE
jgi:hypothetical protein